MATSEKYNPEGAFGDDLLIKSEGIHKKKQVMSGFIGSRMLKQTLNLHVAPDDMIKND